MLSYKDGDVISADTTWSGEVSVSGIVFIPEDVTLTILPGTVVSFQKTPAEYKEGVEGAYEIIIPGSGLRVEGNIIAEGEKGKEIYFTSAEASPAPGDWGCIFLDHTKGSVFTRCRFEYSAYTIHAHFSQFDVSRSVITRNEDGSRLGFTRANYDHCDIRDNTGKGLNFRQSKITVRWCNITGNQDGIFLNEKDAACVIENNNIHGNVMDLRLGDFHSEDVKLSGNWWGTADLKEVQVKIWEREDDPEVGMAVIEPAPRHIAGAGVDGPEFDVAWKFKTGGFVDCNPAVSDGVVYFGSWDKKFYAVKEDTGELLWSFQTGDCVDSSPAVSDGRVYFGSWDRNIYCLNAKDGKLIWKFEMPPSNFDDHRQGSPVVSGKSSSLPAMVFMGGFNGMAYALDAEKGIKINEYKTGGIIRSKAEFHIWTCSFEPWVMDCVLFIVGSSDGKVYAFSDLNGVGWEFKTDDVVFSSPIKINEASLPAKIFFGSRDGGLYCVDLSGQLFWMYDTGSRIEYSSPAIKIRNNAPLEYEVFIGDCSGTLHAVNKDTGQAAWKFTGGGGIYSSPQLSGRYVVYGDNAGNVYALDPSDGSLASRFKAGDAVQGLSTGPEGAIYAGSRDGYVYKLRLGN